MNRLTEKKEHGEWSLKGVDWQQLYVGRTITQEVKEKLLAALFKLLHYENSGLRPDEVRELAENNGWILASEKMPAKDGRYLVTFKHDTEAYLVGYGSCQRTVLGYPIGHGWYNLQTADYYAKDSIIAWRPLPEPYKEKQNAEERNR